MTADRDPDREREALAWLVDAPRARERAQRLSELLRLKPDDAEPKPDADSDDSSGGQ